jgi:hypothetical protein
MKNASVAPIFVGGTILVLCMLSLTGCYYFRPTGPCLGVGCPARTAGQSGQYKKNQSPKAQNAQGQTPTRSPALPKAGN